VDGILAELAKLNAPLGYSLTSTWDAVEQQQSPAPPFSPETQILLSNLIKDP
jgi:hypothetical protein